MTPSTVCATTVCFSRSRYTGKERDTESGNDYFGARYYASTMGRFLSPDWSAKAEPVPYARLDDPQSLNLYVYGGNNPLIHIDADGHCWPQWACNFFSNVGQRFANTWNYGYFKTNSQVDAIAKQGAGRLKANGYSPEGLHKSDLLRAATLGAGAKSFQTYLKHHPNLEPYAGRTSGTGTPEENVQLRDRSRHHMNEKGYGEAELDKSSSNPDAIRGREQQLIEANGGAQWVERPAMRSMVSLIAIPIRERTWVRQNPSLARQRAPE